MLFCPSAFYELNLSEKQPLVIYGNDQYCLKFFMPVLSSLFGYISNVVC